MWVRRAMCREGGREREEEEEGFIDNQQVTEGR